jgi:hypothetical protein
MYTIYVRCLKLAIENYMAHIQLPKYYAVSVHRQLPKEQFNVLVIK